MPIVEVPYKIYDLENITGNDRFDHVYRLTFGPRICFVGFRKNAFCHFSSLYFYAGSYGWEKFTSTGFRSIFFNREIDPPSDEDMREFLTGIIEEKGLSLREDDMVQAALF